MRWPFKILGSFVFIVFALSFYLSMSGFNDVVTLDKYNRIKSGMFYAEVVSIIGKDGEELSRSDIPGVQVFMPPIETIMFQWKNGNGSNMNAMFQNNSLISKAQYGLK